MLGVTGLPGAVEGLGLVVGPDGGIGGSGLVSGVGCWTVQALNPRTRLSRVIRASTVIAAFPDYWSGLSMVNDCGAVVLLAIGWLRPTHSPAVG